MLQILMKLLGLPPNMPKQVYEDAKTITIHLRCARCGEPIALRIRKTDEVQRDYDGADYAFYVQKVAMGNRCFNQIPIRLELDAAYKIIRKEIAGGQYITAEEFLALGHQAGMDAAPTT